jgi:hypothetical protein
MTENERAWEIGVLRDDGSPHTLHRYHACGLGGHQSSEAGVIELDSGAKHVEGLRGCLWA